MENMNIKKFENFENNLNESIRIGKHIYSVIKTDDGVIYANKDGVLGHNDTFISWQVLDNIYIKIKKGVI